MTLAFLSVKITEALHTNGQLVNGFSKFPPGIFERDNHDYKPPFVLAFIPTFICLHGII